MAIVVRMGRTSGSIALKLSNLASLDPRLQARGIKGLSGASMLDRETWQDFQSNKNTLAPTSQELLNDLNTGSPDAHVDVLPDAGIVVRTFPTGDSTVLREVSVRRGQDYFRNVVLNHYGSRCAITGLAIRELLVASHIGPCAAREGSRYDERNSIALNALHDKAFDRGLITFDVDLKLVCAPSLHDHFAEEAIAQNFKVFEGKQLTIPSESSGPDTEYVAWHRSEVFEK